MSINVDIDVSWIASALSCIGLLTTIGLAMTVGRCVVAGCPRQLNRHCEDYDS
ncbi:MAG: hypothetical protein FWC76_04785 [Defluviitaleaceae bacterium]|nr:hypothetical protein [Defluviitaleaceae bacterium]